MGPPGRSCSLHFKEGFKSRYLSLPGLYYFGPPEPQLVHDVGFFVTEVLQDIGFVDQRQVVFVYLPHPVFSDEGLQQLQEGFAVGQQLPVSLVVRLVGRFWVFLAIVRQCDHFLTVLYHGSSRDGRGGRMYDRMILTLEAISCRRF